MLYEVITAEVVAPTMQPRRPNLALGRIDIVAGIDLGNGRDTVLLTGQGEAAGRSADLAVVGITCPDQAADASYNFV